MQQEIATFIQHLKAERNASPHTLEAYSRDLQQFATFISKEFGPTFPIHQITHLHIRRYLASLHKELSKSSIGRKLAAIRSLFRFLLRRGLLEKNPAELVSTPKREKKLPFHLDIDEITTLVEAPAAITPLSIRDRAILETLYSSGLRVSELVAMEIQDLDVSEGIIRIRGDQDVIKNLTKSNFDLSVDLKNAQEGEQAATVRDDVDAGGGPVHPVGAQIDVVAAYH